MAGYSGTPLYKKLGIKAGQRVYLKNAPTNYDELIAPLSNQIQYLQRLTNKLDLIHIFTNNRIELEQYLPTFMQKINQDGVIWVSWPKKASKIPTTVDENVIRAVALPLGLVDVKVCAVDDVWSALKLVIRKEKRIS